MTDTLQWVCAPYELSSADRDRLRRDVAFAEHFMRRISIGSTFCEDRGYGWDAEQERREGSDRVFACLRTWPIFRRLLPGLRHYRHVPNPVVGLHSIPIDDAIVADLVLTDRWSVTGRHGRDWDEWFVAIVFGADAIHVKEETVATTTGGRPLSESETAIGYAEPSTGPFWTTLREKLGSSEADKAAALASRMREAVAPCDTCGRAAQSYRIDGSALVMSGVGLAEWRATIPVDDLLTVRKALASQDMPALAAIDSAWVPRYRAADDASYCNLHHPERVPPGLADRTTPKGSP